MKIISLLCLFVSATLMSSCSNGPRLTPGPQLTVVAAEELPPPEGVIVGSQTRPYLIGPNDKLTISVFGFPELTREVTVDAAGRMSLPLVGQVVAAGLTPAQLTQSIRQALRNSFVRDPQVAVNVDQAASQVITVDGQVTEPGIYPVIGRMTLIRAIASAKGASEFARLQDVVVYRAVGKQQMAALYNLDAIRRGAYPDPEIYANDTVVVGDSPSRRLFRDILQASPLIVTPIIALLNNGGI